MMCEACTEGRHYACGLQTWCECDCDPDDPWSYQNDPSDAPENQPLLIGMDLGSGPDLTVYACREHINTPHPACPACAEVARRSAVPQGEPRG